MTDPKLFGARVRLDLDGFGLEGVGLLLAVQKVEGSNPFSRVAVQGFVRAPFGPLIGPMAR
jgi:hypothetical protein